jgi:hypothetical protein
MESQVEETHVPLYIAGNLCARFMYTYISVHSTVLQEPVSPTGNEDAAAHDSFATCWRDYALLGRRHVSVA